MTLGTDGSKTCRGCELRQRQEGSTQSPGFGYFWGGVRVVGGFYDDEGNGGFGIDGIC